VPRVALVAAPAIVDRLRIVAVADVCPAADRACVNFHRVPLVAAARPPDLFTPRQRFVRSCHPGARLSLAEDGRFDGAVTLDERRGYVGTHPDVVAVTVQTAASDWAAARGGTDMEPILQVWLARKYELTHPRQ
jgi:hypothetical protein